MPTELQPSPVPAESRSSRVHRVVIIGSGFGGLIAAKKLRRAGVEVTLISRTNHHLFQPLLYQVATGILSEGEIAPATREILRRQDNVRVLLGDVSDISLDERTVTSWAAGKPTVTPYDSLIVAAGAKTAYFGNDQFAAYAPGLKSIDDALEVRAKVMGAFEYAEVATDENERKAWQTFVVVGGGATGVELAGQIAELSHRTLRRDFRTIDPRQTRILLVDAGDSVLANFGSRLSASAVRRLERLGAEVWLGEKVVGVDEDGLTTQDSSGNRSTTRARTVVWAAGVQASSLGESLAEQSGAELDRGGRVRVQPDCTLPGHPEVFVIGDMMTMNDYPGVAQVAMQQGAYAAKAIQLRLKQRAPQKPFHYFDKGSLATVSRFDAVASVGPFRFGGFIAWLLWLAVHLLYLVGFKNRVTTVMHWAVSFIGRARSERTVPRARFDPVRSLSNEADLVQTRR